MRGHRTTPAFLGRLPRASLARRLQKGGEMRKALPASVLALLTAVPALASDPFGLDAEVDGQRASRSYNTLEQAYNSLSSASLRSIFPTYAGDASAVRATLNLRGVQALGSFAPTSPILRFQVPGAGIDEVFNGGTREGSLQQLQKWFQGQGQSRVNTLLRYAVRTTPIDPIAGNPNSALTGLAVSDFGRAVDASLGEGAAFGIAARFGSFSASGYNSQNLTLPLDYNWQITPRDTLQLDVPLSYIDNSGATSYSGNIGLLYRRQVTDSWTLQASARVGAAGSVDLGAGAGIYGLGLTSTYVARLPAQLRLTVANGINYLSTFPVSIGRYSLDYGVSNTVFRNGLVLSRSLGVELWSWPLTGSVFAVDTRFTGTPVYVRHFQEFGTYVSAGGQARGGLGVTLTTGDRGLFGFTVNTGVRF